MINWMTPFVKQIPLVLSLIGFGSLLGIYINNYFVRKRETREKKLFAYQNFIDKFSIFPWDIMHAGFGTESNDTVSLRDAFSIMGEFHARHRILDNLFLIGSSELWLKTKSYRYIYTSICNMWFDLQSLVRDKKIVNMEFWFWLHLIGALDNTGTPGDSVAQQIEEYKKDKGETPFYFFLKRYSDKNLIGEIKPIYNDILKIMRKELT